MLISTELVRALPYIRYREWQREIWLNDLSSNQSKDNGATSNPFREDIQSKNLFLYGKDFLFKIVNLMIELEEYKKALGPITDDLSEEKIIEVRQIQDELAEILYVLWVENRKEQITKIKSQCQQLIQEKIVSSIVE
jgi:hypothetical protein